MTTAARRLPGPASGSATSTPGSVIITVPIRQLVTTASGRSEVPDDLAVTVVRAGSGQAVWDAGPAAGGITGEDPADAPAP